MVTDKSAIVVSQLSLVDLAGSERNLRTRAAGDRIKEAGRYGRENILCVDDMVIVDPCIKASHCKLYRYYVVIILRMKFQLILYFVTIFFASQNFLFLACFSLMHTCLFIPPSQQKSLSMLLSS